MFMPLLQAVEECENSSKVKYLYGHYSYSWFFDFLLASSCWWGVANFWNNFSPCVCRNFHYATAFHQWTDYLPCRMLVRITRIRGQVLIRLHRYANFHWNDASTIETCFHLYRIFLTPTVLENAAVKIRFIDEGHGIHHSELSMLILRWCGDLICT